MSATRLVLVVDDHDDSREMYRMALESYGYAVAEAAHAEAALAAASVRLPGAVISDVRMPGDVSVEDLCDYFHERRVPVIAITGLPEGDAEVRRIRDRCVSVMIKPVTPDALREELARVFGRESAPA
jgi:DNA-binding NtrC family response regulator